jgi:hypothetical protein
MALLSTWENKDEHENNITSSLENENAGVNGKSRQLSQRIKTLDLIDKTVDTKVFLVCLKGGLFY